MRPIASKLPYEPIIVYTAPEHYTDASIDEMFAAIAAQLDEHGPCYLIANTVSSDLDFPKMIKVMKGQTRGGPGTSSDTRILEAVFVASHAVVTLLRDMMAQSQATSQRYVPLFSDYQEALDFLRVRIKLAARQAEASPDSSSV